MKSSPFYTGGKIVSAVVAISVAGCLIHRQQKPAANTVTDGLLIEIQKQEQKPISLETSAHPVAADVANAPVIGISITDEGIVKNISEIQPDEFKQLMHRIETVVMDTPFFVTTKSMVPPIDDERFYLYIYKEGHQQIVNYTLIPRTSWQNTKQDVEYFYQQQNLDTSSCPEKVQLQKGEEPVINLLVQPEWKIQMKLTDIDQIRTEYMTTFSSSKSLAPAISGDNYTLLVYRNGIKSEFFTTLLDDSEWDDLRKEILYCRAVSLSHLYRIQEPQE